jgi:flavodoxin
MTKAIVLYNSRGGNTKQIAESIAEGLGTKAFSNKKIPNLEDYELVVVGSWVIMGMLSFAGKRYLRRISRKKLSGKKVALFFTSGAPDDIHPFTQDSENPRQIKQIMFDAMEKILKKNKEITILPERFYCKGASRMTKGGEPKEPIGHPNEEDCSNAVAFGEQLKKQLEK